MYIYLVTGDWGHSSFTSICLRRNTAVMQHYKTGINATVTDRDIPLYISQKHRQNQD